MKKYIMILMLIVFLSLSVQGESYPQGEDYEFAVICFSNGYCSGAGVCNATVFYPNNSLLLDNVGMTNNINYYNYTINGSQLNQLGVYDVKGFCSDAGNTQEIDFTFSITPNGEDQSLMTVLVQAFIICLFLFFMFCFYMMKRQIDFARWEKNILAKYEFRNSPKALFTSVGHVFMKESFMAYYLLAFPVMALLINLVNLFTVEPIAFLNEIFLLLYYH